ncbi:MAG: hypothetical protein QOH93_1993, partial [Chloroflexia bacterium]|nr:hypothetical protein [Chloroflexia bacterium]
MTLRRKPIARRLTRAFLRRRSSNRTWNKDTDTDFLLRGLHRSPLRFCTTRDRLATQKPGLTATQLAISRYVGAHPGVTISQIAEQVPSIKDGSYEEAHSAVVALVDKGLIRPCGRAPLELVDDRYERVAACVVCGAPSRGQKTLFWKYGTPVVRCRECGLLYANPRWKASELFGRYTAEYWEQYAGTIRDTSVDEQANYARWLPFLAVHDPVRLHNRLLDVGCATGEFLLAAKTRDWEVYGVETSPPAAAQAERLAGAIVHAGTLETATFPHAHFDVITMWDVIEHLQDPRGYLQQIAALLRPGGMLSITTPNIHSLAYRLLGPDWTPV